jgi:hypothetical protein
MLSFNNLTMFNKTGNINVKAGSRGELRNLKNSQHPKPERLCRLLSSYFPGMSRLFDLAERQFGLENVTKT